MVITCEKCQTQFQLDDSRIPERGVRVRCSRCKHAFFVKLSGGAGDPVDDHAAEHALAEDEERQAAPTQELARVGTLRGEAEEESDWEFNEDGLDSEPDLTTAREAVDDLLGSVDAAPLGEGVDGLISTDSDLDDEVDSLLDSTGSSSGLEAAEVPADPVATEPSEAEAPVAPPPARTPARAAEEELGSPENWDFFSDEPESSPPERADFSQTPIGQIQLASRPTLERPTIEVDAEPSRRGQRLRGLAGAAGWLSVALLVLGGLHGGIVAQRAGPLPVRTADAAFGLKAIGVGGRWLDNAAAGPIYVISGTLLRAGSQPTLPGAWLAVRLFDENGELLAEEAAAAGPALPEARLREQDPRELRAAQAEAALAMASVPLLPGESRAFQAILSDLPEAASRFDLAAIPLEARPTALEAPGTGVP